MQRQRDDLIILEVVSVGNYFHFDLYFAFLYLWVVLIRSNGFFMFSPLSLIPLNIIVSQTLHQLTQDIFLAFKLKVDSKLLQCTICSPNPSH